MLIHDNTIAIALLIFVLTCIACIFIVVLAYVAARAASLGWHRSKWEYFSKVWKQISGEKENGKG